MRPPPTEPARAPAPPAAAPPATGAPDAACCEREALVAFMEGLGDSLGCAWEDAPLWLLDRREPPR